MIFNMIRTSERRLPSRHDLLINQTLSRLFSMLLYTSQIHPGAAPVQRLSCELLELIFLAYCEEPCKGVGPGNSGLPCEIHLSHICCFWRQIALNMRRLWSTILPDRLVRYQDGGVSDRLIRIYIERSNGIGLTVHLCPSAAILLAQNSNLWENVYIEDLPQISPAAAAKMGGNLSKLISLSCTFGPQLENQDLFRYAPVLSSVEYTCTRGVNTVNPNLPWDQVTDLVLKASTLCQGLDALARATSLTSVRFSRGLWHGADERWPKQPVCSNVKIFSAFISLGRGDLSMYLRSMVLKSLISLSFDLYGNSKFAAELDYAVDAFSQFVSYSSTTLSRLSLIGNVVSSLWFDIFLTRCHRRDVAFHNQTHPRDSYQPHIARIS
jgi:hypothetical protein